MFRLNFRDLSDEELKLFRQLSPFIGSIPLWLGPAIYSINCGSFKLKFWSRLVLDQFDYTLSVIPAWNQTVEANATATYPDGPYRPYNLLGPSGFGWRVGLVDSVCLDESSIQPLDRFGEVRWPLNPGQEYRRLHLLGRPGCLALT